MLFWSEPLLLPRPSQPGYVFERDPSKVKSMQIKDVRLVRGLDSIAHSFIHTSIHVQDTPWMCQEPGSQKEENNPYPCKAHDFVGESEKIIAK